MKLGFVTAILPELNLNQVLEFAAAERFACIEVEDDTFGRTLACRKQALRLARNVLEPYF